MAGQFVEVRAKLTPGRVVRDRFAVNVDGIRKIMNKNTKIISGIADINGAQLYYEMKGTGPALLLLHAGIADGRMWMRNLKDFRKRIR